MLLTALVAALLSACGGDDVAAPDTGSGADAGVDGGPWVVAPPEPPAAPAPPSRECPTGFTLTADGVCDPWPEGSPECAPDAMRAPGDAACATLGPECPAEGEWASDLPSGGAILFVSSSAAPGGDGSRGAPFGTIGDAIEAAGDEVVIALARGTYDEAVRLGGGRTLHGACAGGTIVAPSSGTAPTLYVGGGMARLQNLTISGAGPGVSAAGSAVTHLRNVIVTDNADFGVRAVFGSTIEADGLIVRGTRPARSGGTLGRGLDLAMSSTARITRALFLDNTEFAITVTSGGSIDLDAVAVRHTRPQESDLRRGRALNVAAGVTATVSRSVFEDSAEIGVLFFSEGTTASLEDVVIRRTTPGPAFGGAEGGTGMAVEQGAVVTAQGLLIADSGFSALAAVSEGATFTGEDVVIDGVTGDGQGDLGLGMTAEKTGSIDVTRVIVRDTRTVGVSAKDAGSQLSLTDALVSGVLLRANDDGAGMGVGITRGAAASLTRVRIEDTAGDGLFVTAPGSTLTLEDVDVARTGSDTNPGVGLIAFDAVVVEGQRVALTRSTGFGILLGTTQASVTLSDVSVTDVALDRSPDAPAGYAAGIQVEADGVLALTRVQITGAAMHGVQTLGGSLDLTDLLVRETAQDDDGFFGYGLQANGMAQVRLERAIFDGMLGAGVSALNGGRIEARDIEVRDTESNTGDGRFGWGVAAQAGGSIELTGARLVRNREVGLMAQGAGAAITGTDVIILDTRFNACAEMETCGGGAGFGASADGGSITLTGFQIRRSALGGMQISDNGQADLSNGLISDNPVGVNVQDDPDYDFERLTNGVRFTDNDRNLDVVVVPVPSSDLASAGIAVTPGRDPDF